MADDFTIEDDLSEKERLEIAHAIWQQETVVLNTIGIDVGSSTSHLLFAKITMQRQTQGLSSRFVVSKREVIWRSPIMLTPFLPNGTIDAGKLGDFVHGAYREAGLQRSDVDTGAVILTGEAIKRKNARAIDELFAEEAGKFVCATAGHKLECTLAAHGSGAVRRSREMQECILHIDIGGGTTKLALIDKGRILGVAAFAVGGRLIGIDADSQWSRVDESASLVAAELGLPTDAASLAKPEIRQQIARRLAAIAADYITFSPLDALGAKLLLTEPLKRSVAPSAVTFSGGVSEYIYGREKKEFGDIAKMLATELIGQLSTRTSLPILDPGQGIRATVIGASQFTVQVSGKTIYLPDPSVLPVRNVPVVQIGLDLARDIDGDAVVEAIHSTMSHLDLAPGARVALAFTWNGDPEFGRLEALGKALMRAVAPDGSRSEPLLLMIDGDIGKTLGHILHEELNLKGKLVSIDGVQLQELDFVDVGELISPPGVVPVIIKSLLFS
jgi:ethanolamine utilization protein EutA